MRMRDLLCGLTAIAAASTVFAQTAIGTAFSYQGQLRDNDAPASGDYDLQFRLFNDSTQVGSTICVDNVAVVDGLFTVALDFGSQFDGNKRSLEIGVRPAGSIGDCASGGYTTLAPRQSITPAPYALKVAGIDGHSLDGAGGTPVDAVFVNAAGFVGVNTTAPSTHLTVNGNSDIVGALGVGRLPGGFQLDVRSPGNGVARFDSPDTYGTVSAFVNASVGGRAWAAVSSGSAHPGGAGKLVFRDIFAAQDRVTFDGLGNVGIGTYTPTQALDVRGSVAIRNTIRLDPLTEPFIVRQYDLFTSGAKNGLGRWGMFLEPATLFLGVPGTDYGSTSNISFGGWLTNSTRQDWMTIVEGGNVGIGTTTPTNRLSIVGNQDISGSLEIGPDAPLDNPGNFSTTVEINGRSGAGVTNPGSAAIVFTNSVFSTPLAWSMGVAGNGEFTFNYNGTAGFDIVNVPKLRITGGSDVAEPFDVNVDDAFTNVDAGANDAESKIQNPKSKIVAGMVVSIDPKHPGELRISTGKYDRTVAGIISGANGVNTGMVLTQKDSIADGQHPVALTGRVYCYVDADAGGAIQPGDLLTTSDTAGHAMKVRDHNAAQGAIIGKAMTSLESGKGMVLVLVNLQ
ncbi:MAG: hypothetical protein ACKVS9_02400 [Phycisphaerae bacterium]